jgi:HEAT repeat protein
VRAGAISSLSYLRADALRSHLGALLGDPSENVREEAARAVIGLEARDAVRALVDLLRDRSDRTKTLAIDALAKLEAPELRPHLPELLAHGRERVRELAAAATGTQRVRETVPVLLSIASGNNGYALRRATLKALGDIGDPSAVQPLRELLGDVVSSTDAAAALAALGQAGEAALLEASDSGDAAVSRAALGGLLKVDTRAALGRILAADGGRGSGIRLGEWVGLTTSLHLELLSDPRPYVRAAAAGVWNVHPV